MNFINIPEEVIRCGYVTLYADDKYTIEKDVDRYNEYITECRATQKKAAQIRLGYLIMNPLAIAVLTIFDFGAVFYRGALSCSMLAIYLASFVLFAGIKRNLILAAAVSPVLLILDIRFISLLIVNALFAFFYEKIESPLRSHITYPSFYTIDIHYSRGNRPKTTTHRE